MNHFRRTILGLSQVPLDDGEGLLRLFDVPHTYLVSYALIPGREDWSNQIPDIACGISYREGPIH